MYLAERERGYPPFKASLCPALSRISTPVRINFFFFFSEDECEFQRSERNIPMVR